jgi:rhodanese-related sulfurtransferase
MNYLYFIAFTFLFACSGQNEQTSGGYNSTAIVTSETVEKDPQYKIISAEDFEKAIQSGTPINIIDVRTPEEVAEGIISGAIPMNFYDEDFSNQLKTLDVTVPTYIYCRSGGRSGKAALLMERMGFKEVYDLDGGITAWLSQNKPVVKQ